MHLMIIRYIYARTHAIWNRHTYMCICTHTICISDDNLWRICTHTCNMEQTYIHVYTHAYILHTRIICMRASTHVCMSVPYGRCACIYVTSSHQYVCVRIRMFVWVCMFQSTIYTHAHVHAHVPQGVRTDDVDIHTLSHRHTHTLIMCVYDLKHQVPYGDGFMFPPPWFKNCESASSRVRLYMYIHI